MCGMQGTHLKSAGLLKKLPPSPLEWMQDLNAHRLPIVAVVKLIVSIIESCRLPGSPLRFDTMKLSSSIMCAVTDNN